MAFITSPAENVSFLPFEFIDKRQISSRLLEEERIFSSKDLPYTTQFIPLDVLCTLLAEGNKIKVESPSGELKFKILKVTR